MQHKNHTLNYVIGIILIIILAIISLTVGTANMSLLDILSGGADFSQWQILTQSRIPRTLALILAGGSLSIAGYIMQMLVQNRFVEPSTTGVTEASGLGILMVTIIFPASSILLKMGVAIIFSLVATFLFIYIINSLRKKDTIIVPLLGMTFSGVISAFSMFLAWQYQLQGTLNAWTLGDFSGVIAGRYELLYVTLVVSVIAYYFADLFMVVALGENLAKNLGVKYREITLIGLAIVAITSAVVTVVAGSLPFLGIIIPNLVSLLFGDYARKSLPYMAIGGALFVLFSDILSRTLIAPAEIPVGVVMGVLGAFIFLVLLLKKRVYVH